MRVWVLAMTALLTAGALAGCAGTDDPGTDDAGIEVPSDENGGNGNGDAPSDDDNGNGGTQEPQDPTAPQEPEPREPPTADLNASVTEGEAPLEVVFTLDGGSPDGRDITWTLDVNGDGEADHSGSELPAEVTHTYEAAGDYAVVFTVTDAEYTVEDTLEIVVAAAADFEEGQVSSMTAGVFAQAVIGRTPFTLERSHGTLELVVFLEEPAADMLGEEYTVRVTPPSGGNDDYRTTNGDPILIPDPEVGTYEVGVFPAVGGAWDFTVDYCAFTTVHCSG